MEEYGKDYLVLTYIGNCGIMHSLQDTVFVTSGVRIILTPLKDLFSV